jgi:hypothetical protein
MRAVAADIAAAKPVMTTAEMTVRTTTRVRCMRRLLWTWPEIARRG